MRKIIFVLLTGMMLFIPQSLCAGLRTYSLKIDPSSSPQPPLPQASPGRRMPAFNPVTVEIDEESGDMGILFNRSIDDVNITITHNGTTIEDDNICVIYGQCIIYNMNNYEEGQYVLTIENEGNILSKYEISIYEE